MDWKPISTVPKDGTPVVIRQTRLSYAKRVFDTSLNIWQEMDFKDATDNNYVITYEEWIAADEYERAEK